MDESEILSRVADLVQAEHTLRAEHAEGMPEADAARLQRIEESLDQCWDLLRQRRARREFGQDPEASEIRSTDTVEHYQQ